MLDIEKIHKFPLTTNHLCLYTRVMNNISRKRFIVGSGLSVVAGVMGMSAAQASQGTRDNFEAILYHGGYFPNESELKALGKTRKEIEEFQTWLRTVPVDVLKASDSHRAEQEEVLKRSKHPVSKRPNARPMAYEIWYKLKTRRHGERTYTRIGQTYFSPVETLALMPSNYTMARSLVLVGPSPSNTYWTTWRIGGGWRYFGIQHGEFYPSVTGVDIRPSFR